MALDFPNAPTNGQAFAGPNSAVWVWNSTSATWDAGGPSLFLPLSGGTMTGAINALDPTTSTNPVTLGYFNTHSSAVTVGDVAPTAPTPGSLWWSSAPGDGQLYLYYADPNTSQWVVANHIGGGPFLALSGGTLSGALTLNGNAASALQAVPLQQLNSAIATSPALNDVGRNVIMNSLMNVAQRGTGPWTTTGVYTLDRWVLGVTGDTVSVSQAPLNDTQRVQIGDEAAINAMVNNFTGTATAGSYNLIQQKTEDVRRLANKTVAVSFWAWGSAAKLGVAIDQEFGSGGSPSAAVTGVGQSVTLTTNPARFSLTFTLPSVAGKTLGTNNNSDTTLVFWCSSSSTYATRAGNIGVQSGTVALWGVQLEVGSTMTPLEKVDPGEDLKRCQRFYQAGGLFVWGGIVSASPGFGTTQSFPPMRGVPTVTLSAQNYGTGMSAATVGSVATCSAQFSATGSGSGWNWWATNYTLSADL